MWTIGNWTVDTVRLTATHEGRSVSLTTNEVLLLDFLQQRGEPVQRAEILHEVFGYSKSVKSRAVDMALNRLRTKLERNPKSPTLLLSRRGVGIWLEPSSLQATSVPVDIPTLRFGTPYMPRESSEQAVLDLMKAGWRVVTIVGPGGGGKTRLAVEASRHVDGEVVVVPLSGCVDEASVVNRLSSVLGAEGLDGVQRALEARRALCLLDEAEPILEAVRAVVQAASGARFLITSRQALGIADEGVYELPSMIGDEATEFFRSRLAASRPNRDVAEADLSRALLHLDGLPLAMELAAAHPSGLRALVISLSEGQAPRGGEWLQATVHRSLQPLDDAQKRVLALLCLCEGPLEPDDIQAWLGAEGVATFYDLVDRSLLMRQGAGWLVLSTLRTDVRAFPLDWGALVDVRNEWLARRCESLDQQWRSDLGAAEVLRRLLPTLLAAFPTLSADRSARVATAVVHIIDAIGPIGLCHGIVRAAVAANPNDPRLRALSAMLPESAEITPRVQAALTHSDPDVRFLGLAVWVSLCIGDIDPQTFRDLRAATDDPYQRLQMEIWGLDVQTFREGTGFEELATLVATGSTFPALHMRALAILADVRYGQQDYALSVALYDRVLAAYKAHDLHRATLVIAYFRALALGGLDPHGGIEAHLENVRLRRRYGESTANSEAAAGLLCYQVGDLPQAEQLLASSLAGGMTARRLVVTQGVLAATRLRRGVASAQAELSAVHDETYARTHRDQSPAGPAFRVWAHGEVALHRGEDAGSVRDACDQALKAPVRTTLRALLSDLRQRAAAAT